MTEEELWEIARHDNARGEFPLLREMWVEKGDKNDWALLNSLHYKATSVPVGAFYTRVRFRGETIGCCVFGMSRPLLKERHAVFPRLKPGQDTQATNIHRYRYINDNFRVIGRLVVDTMFRSAGVAYRFANISARMSGRQYVEIQSSMSKYNMFAHRAGFQFAKPIRSMHYEKGLKFMRKYFAAHPADQEALMQEYEQMSPAMKVKVEKELKEFYFANSPLEKTGSRRFYSERVVDNWSVRRTISKIQGLCFSSPLYGFYKTPEEQGPLPLRIPLLAFDQQDTNSALNPNKFKEIPNWTELEREIEERNWSAPTILPDAAAIEPQVDADHAEDILEELPRESSELKNLEQAIHENKIEDHELNSINKV